MIKNEYFVSYNANNGKRQGFGNLVVALEHKITGMAQVRKIQEDVSAFIGDDMEPQNIVVINFVFLRQVNI